jgi:hypothetical protein
MLWLMVKIEVVDASAACIELHSMYKLKHNPDQQVLGAAGWCCALPDC